MTALALAGAVLCGVPATASAVTTRTMETYATLAAQADATIAFSDTGITSAQTGGYEVDGCNLTITEAGTYTLTGSCANGSVTVKKGVTGVTLVLDSLTLTSTTSGAPICCNKNTGVTIVAQGTSSLTDAEDAASDASEGAAIKAKSGATVTLTGSGTLNVTGSTKNAIKGASGTSVVVGASAADALTLSVAATSNGIASDGSVTVNGGTVNLGSSSSYIGNDGIKSEPEGDDNDSAGTVTVNGGTITAYTTGDGIQAGYETSYTDDAGATVDVTEAKRSGSQGKVAINGGTIAITTKRVSAGSSSTAGDGIQAAKELLVAGGNVTVSTWGGTSAGSSFAQADSAVESATGEGISAKGLKASEDGTGAVTMTGGSVTLDCADDAVHSDGTLSVTGGTLTAASADDGLHADYGLSLGTSGSSSTTSPKVSVTKSVEGIEAAQVNVYSGDIDVVSSDDGVNAANKDLGSSSSAYDFQLNIAGGDLYVNAQGDGLDSNGDITVTGGTTRVFGSNSGGNGVFDTGDTSADTFVVTGGTLLGVGTADMAVVPTRGSYVVFGASGGMGGPGGGMWSMSDDASADATLTSQAFGRPGGGSSGSSVSIAANSTVAVVGPSGATVIDGVSPRSATWVMLAGSNLVSGTYTLKVNGSSVATASLSTASSSTGSTTPSQPGGSGTGTGTGAGTGTGTSTGSTSGSLSDDLTGSYARQTMYRLYNPNSGEHFYTASVAERSALVAAGWTYEGTAWTAPTTGTNVYRLYNSYAGDHHYTTSATERDALVDAGWTYEGVSWHSASSSGVALHRLYNPNATTGTHHYTKSTTERDTLVALGWRYEGISWYGLSV